MAVTPRSTNVRAVTYPVTMPSRSLALGRERAPQLVLALVVLIAWGFGFGASSEGIAAALAATAVAWLVGSAFLRDRGEYHRALAVRLVRFHTKRLVRVLHEDTAAPYLHFKRGIAWLSQRPRLPHG